MGIRKTEGPTAPGSPASTEPGSGQEPKRAPLREPNPPSPVRKPGVFGTLSRAFTRSKRPKAGTATSKAPPVRESDWGKHANCYAYATNCPEPARGEQGGAKPGAASGTAVNPGGDDYASQLRDGAERDGLVPLAGTPEAPPSRDPSDGGHCVALLSSETGFHWLRRNEDTGVWTWKDGNGDTVKHRIFSMTQNDYVEVGGPGGPPLEDLLSHGENYAPWRYGGMSFTGFFRVPPDGVAVAGQDT